MAPYYLQKEVQISWYALSPGLTWLFILAFPFDLHFHQIQPRQTWQYVLLLPTDSTFPLLGLSSHCDCSWNLTPTFLLIIYDLHLLKSSLLSALNLVL